MSEWVKRLEEGARNCAASVTQARIVAMVHRELSLFVQGGPGREVGFAPPSKGEIDAWREALVNGYNAGLQDAGDLVRSRLGKKVPGGDRLLEDLFVMRLPVKAADSQKP